MLTIITSPVFKKKSFICDKNSNRLINNFYVFKESVRHMHPGTHLKTNHFFYIEIFLVLKLNSIQIFKFFGRGSSRILTDSNRFV